VRTEKRPRARGSVSPSALPSARDLALGKDFLI
jgi:hypothetical protein